MNFRNLIASGSRLGKRFCATVFSPASSAGVVESSVSASPTAASRQREIYKKLSKLSVTGGTVTQTLNQFIMEGTPVRKDDLFRCAKDLRKFRRHQHALEIFDWMEMRKMTLSIADHAIRLDLIAKTKGLEAAESYFNGLDPSTKSHQSTYGALMNCYCVELKEEKAKSHFEKMDELNFVNNTLPFNNMMSMYMRLGQPEKVSLLVDEMKKREIRPCGITYSIWMQSCGSLNDLEGLEKVIDEMNKDSEAKTTWNTFSSLAGIYTKAGLHEKAESALRTMEEKMNPNNRDAHHFLRNVYEGMLTRQREKGRSKGGKGENFSAQQLQQAHEEYDNETTLFVFRLKSLKQGQTRSLLTQAARHHAAQLCFFKKALNSLEEVEPHVQMVTESQHIDYHFSGLEDDDEIENNEEDDSEVNDDGELSFEYRMSDKDQNADSSPSVSSQLGQSDITFPLVAGLNTAQLENKEASYGRSRSYRRDVRIESQSAPLFAENRTMPPSEKLLRMRSSLTRKFSTYALPTPVETARSPSSITILANNNMASSNPAKAITKNNWYSSPLEARGPSKVSSRPMSALKEQVLRESNKNTSSQLPRPSSDGLLYSRMGSLKRRSFSGPITNKPLPNKPLSSAPRLYSGPIPRSSVSKLPKVSTSSPTASPTFVSTPKISELHELPRPPPPSSISAKSSRVFGYSAPLVSKSQLLSKPLVSSSAAPLPIPPAITRSFSIPTSNLRATELDMSKTSVGANKLSTASPPLTPMSLSHPPPSAITEHAEHLTISKQERT